MSRYKAYPEYKDSGVEWLGEIPFQWEISPLKYLATFTGGGTPSKENPDFWDGNIPWVSPKDMKKPRISTTIDNITDSAIRQSSTNLLEKGALLMVVRSGILQHSIPVAINDVPISLNQDMKALRFFAPLLSEYAFYFVEGNQSRLLLEWSKEGATVESIEHEFLANTFFPCPPLSERTAIIAFLDHETAKIDALIEKQKRLIELLKEKRQAVISHAVTKGLNPNAPMKDSGVEWLGEVPAHWKTSKLLNLTSRIGDGLHAAPEYQDGTGIYFINGNNLVDGQIFIGTTAKEVPVFEYEKNYIFLNSSSVLLSINGTVGNVALFNGEKIVLGKSSAYINCFEALRAEYLMIFLQSDNSRRYFEQEVTGTTIFNLSLNSIRKIRVSIPSISEQNEIVCFCKRQKEKYAKLVRKRRL